MGSIGHLLAEFRNARRLSQMDLGLQADVSSRHISFIETGRARPSPEMLMRLADVMDLPHRETNLLFVASGYAPVYSDMAREAKSMEPVQQALDLMLANHDPFPAAVLDSAWNLLQANQSLQRLMALFLTPDRLSRHLNVLELVFDPAGLKPWLGNWDEVAGFLLRRLRRQVQAFPRDDVRELYDRLLEMAPPPDWQHPPLANLEGPMITSDISIGGHSLRLFSLLSSFGTALDSGMQELMIESYFPADEASRQFLLGLDA